MFDTTWWRLRPRSALASVKKRLIAASRLPRLLREHYIVIVRHRGGMNVKNVSQIKVAPALTLAAKLSLAEIADDIVCPNPIRRTFSSADRHRKTSEPQQIAVERVHWTTSATVIIQEWSLQIRGRSRSQDPSAVRLQTPPAGDTHWADCVKGTPSMVTREVPSLSEHGTARIAQLERKNAFLRSAFECLQAEVAELKLVTTSSPSQSSPPSGTADVPIEMPSEAPADERPAKKRALPQPLRDEGLEDLISNFSEFKNDMKEFQAELRNTLKSLSEPF
ncbi:hypothetical protein HPB51_018939 [Rhipicephalus microplus]|uniref:Uncharacterized protein n=1 Tax=Rhipicephalus microplus TaxID=6941 RepID=A0A9J6DB98_RHIMP|nr:hypothetical protein HPB51_018939 [Rhipicephalus microplus]